HPQADPRAAGRARSRALLADPPGDDRERGFHRVGQARFEGPGGDLPSRSRGEAGRLAGVYLAVQTDVNFAIAPLASKWTVAIAASRSARTSATRSPNCRACTSRSRASGCGIAPWWMRMARRCAAQ